MPKVKHFWYFEGEQIPRATEFADQTIVTMDKTQTLIHMIVKNGHFVVFDKTNA